VFDLNADPYEYVNVVGLPHSMVAKVRKKGAKPLHFLSKNTDFLKRLGYVGVIAFPIIPGIFCQGPNKNFRMALSFLDSPKNPVFYVLGDV
jgi:hypothetical protein